MGGGVQTPSFWTTLAGEQKPVTWLCQMLLICENRTLLILHGDKIQCVNLNEDL